jgi:DEAD/DEAH box helicase domain-containing protein
LPEERREIESLLFGGQLRGVVSTSALEMGIDVGGLDAAILVGYPGSIMSTWQRGGRAGRGTAPAGVFLVAGADALDQYYATKPEAFFAAPPEPAVVDKTNTTIAGAHLLCAAAELPLAADEPVYADLDWRAIRLDLQARGLLLQSAGNEMWVPLVANPHRQVDIRQIGETYTIHHVADERRTIGTVGGSRAFAECHAGAVYLHRGQHLQVLQLDADRRRVTVDDADGSFFTMAQSAKQTEILSVAQSRPLGTTHVHYGRLRITQRITGYEKRSTFEQKLLGVFELELPPTIYETEGLWIEAEPARALDGSGHHRMGSLHGLEHALIALAPLHTLCDAADLGGITFAEHPQVPGGAVFVYDAYPGGLGLAARTFEVLPQLLDAVLERIENCRCDSGCPGCVHSPRCGAGNYPLDKPGTAVALRLLLGRAATAAQAAKKDAAAARLGDPVPAAAAAPLAAPGAAATVLVPPPGPRVLFFDLETLRSAADVGGWHHIDRMGMALGVVFDTRTGEFTTYRETDVAALLDHLDAADLVVGYNVLRFDYQVLSAYEKRDFDRLPTFDMLVALKAVLRQRLSLANLGTATLGRGKSADGLQSLRWVRDGRLDLVEQYCRDDVALTRDLFQFALGEDHLAFELGGRILRTPPLGWDLHRLVQDGARRRAVRVRGGQTSLFGSPPRPTW